MMITMYIWKITYVLLHVAVALFAASIGLIFTFGFYGMFAQMLRLS